MKGLWTSLLLLAATSQAWAQAWLPEEESPSDIIRHTAITIGYDEEHEEPRWVAYALRREHLRDCFERGDNFRSDPNVRTGSALPTDYRNSGFDRGHIAPAGDMKWSKEAMQESFYMSNITPQSPGMNRGKWANLETLVRAWAKQGDETIIVSGPVLAEGLPRIGQSGISVPEQHFKVILRTRQGVRSMIGFLMGQNPVDSALETYALPVADIEHLTGLNFFPHLTAREQERLEGRIEWPQWDFRARFSYDPCSF